MKISRGLAAAAGIGVGAGALALAYASLYERVQYTLRHFAVPALPEGAEPIRVLHISDLHMTPGQVRKAHWVASLSALDPDLVLLTGDNLAHPDAVDLVAKTLRPLFRAPGAFVFGSNDYYAPVFKNPLRYFNPNRDHKYGEPLPTEELRKVLVDGGWLDLNNATADKVVSGLNVHFAGVDDPHFDLDDYDLVAGSVPKSADLSIGLTHSPEPRVLDEFSRDGYDFVAAGHTHGGQVCVPGYGALVTNCGIDRERVKGLHPWEDLWLHVSAGLGTSPYAPVRFACAPEASLLTFVPKAF
ncbi:metallophosphoesterase [Glycomyces sp. TRM65418]|uniref:metallophosphoesterase n=1 Tax=Glycomyces sp. TRM65418 TaxID=2867006 RepID=UPI001CE50C4C|nr:metallophosphoesterase [Glycomyces sp. TRM65418]MCC3763988.1 metallophosphoesterase [Glycomyces sp. TRM65418]QZD53684.1 metallophosphoesterase [Glycomyces sp. TRM65418]